jgi:hypothetical protein
MALIKIIVQEERTRYTPNNAETDETTYWETVHEMISTDQGVVAGTLRAIADKYAPIPKNYRGNVD